MGVGRIPLAYSAYRRIRPYLKSDFVQTVDGNKMFLDPGDSLDIFSHGIHEEFETGFVKKIIQKKDTVLDIGANIGYYTLIFAKLVGDDGKVFAFEPEPSNFSLLEKNVEINGYRNVELAQKAASNKIGKMKLYINEKNAGGHMIYDTHENRNVVEIDVTRLDDHLNNLSTPINFVKMDVEGSEIDVIEGMKDILQKTKDIIIMSEFNPYCIERCGKKPKDYLEALIQNGFKIYDLDAQQKKIIEVSSPELLEKYTFERKTNTNLICKRSQIPMKDLSF